MATASKGTCILKVYIVSSTITTVVSPNEIVICFYTILPYMRVLYTGQTKREGNIWHNLGGNTIILFYNINNEYVNNKQIN